MVSGIVRSIARRLRSLADGLERLAHEPQSASHIVPEVEFDLDPIQEEFALPPVETATSVMESPQPSAFYEVHIPATGSQAGSRSSVPVFSSMDFLPETEEQPRHLRDRRYPDHHPDWNDLEFRDRLRHERYRGLTARERNLISIQPPRTWFQFLGHYAFEMLRLLSHSMLIWLIFFTLLIGGTLVYFVYSILDGWLQTIELLEKS